METTLFQLKLNDSRKVFLAEEGRIFYTATGLSPEAVVSMLDETFDIRHLAQERAYLLCQRPDGSYAGVFELSRGSIEQSVVSVREVMCRVFLLNAVAFVVVHNHPSGNCFPSAADIALAESLCSASKIMDVKFNDFIIIGDGYYSFRGEGRIPL